MHSSRSLTKLCLPAVEDDKHVANAFHRDDRRITDHIALSGIFVPYTDLLSTYVILYSRISGDQRSPYAPKLYLSKDRLAV